MMTRRRLDAALCAGAGFFYLVNRFFLQSAVPGPLGMFLRCWANDVFAGLALCAWTDLLLGFLGRRLDGWRRTVPLLLACALVWEVLAPLWKAGAVFDWWDFVAYQVGGALFLLICKRTEKCGAR